jgi:predicted transcriptional regulator
MNFNVYLDADTVERLNTLARKRGTTRNALIREAVGHLLDQQAHAGWPEAVMAFQGEAAAPRFEAARKGLRPPRKDPLR